MISNVFVLSPRGDTIISKMYRTNPSIGAHERTHTEAFFRKVKFWNEMNNTNSSSSSHSKRNGESSSDGGKNNSGGGGGGGSSSSSHYSNVESDGLMMMNATERGGGFVDDGVKRDPPPVFIMPDGQSYLHVNRNGLIFGCATARNVSPCMVIEVRGNSRDLEKHSTNIARS